MIVDVIISEQDGLNTVLMVRDSLALVHSERACYSGYRITVRAAHTKSLARSLCRPLPVTDSTRSWVQADTDQIETSTPSIQEFRAFTNLLQIKPAPCHEWAE